MFLVSGLKFMFQDLTGLTVFKHIDTQGTGETNVNKESEVQSLMSKV